MYELKKIGIASGARVGGFLSVVIYLAFTAAAILSGATQFQVLTGLSTVAIGVVLAIAFGVVLGALLAWVYNLLADAWGGLHLDFHLLNIGDEMDNRTHREPAHEDSSEKHKF
ncbi:MAG: hypothetical protein A3H70_02365 [Candidatus Komeilibacteria bacterium RIFCSPLOWO2_02_FULL_48_11]|uniref:DUF3566 domain-containing protein n=1 Tax=Candidatus Komeilibacteria bacterium RIFCSPLOWO2_02_FULL_48_11 TaxID=1798553 RepID=A0A1G2BX14_9BACT|nr:MAG: hypothetical protein A3H70_02365 [Candidatus Komeilibacteria bacterium RIFCSPLOWO2_02_FULL_48_11]